ncbi:MAG: hypothetical protein NVSMB38_39380 [Ktedonobacteraceae bacterium]
MQISKNQTHSNDTEVQTEPAHEQVKIYSSTLPIQPTPLIGREQDISVSIALLRRPTVRLLTLVGTPGIGKTRLAIEVAARLSNDFADGTFFIPLAPISTPDLVIPTIAQTLGVKEFGNQPLLTSLKVYLHKKHLQLVLDNFEQIVQAAPFLAELLEAAPHVKLLVTSREALHLRMEKQFPVPPLALPDLKHLPAVTALAQYAAVELFLQRTHIVNPTFHMTPANASTIAAICTRLDGLPLAIELAAARLKLFSPHDLLTKLERRLHVLTRGSRDLPERQQTLRSTIQWSYDLLNADEQRLFRQLSVFVGGCTLKAIQKVYSSTSKSSMIDTLDMVTSLLNKSMIQENEQADGEIRILMLETLREYGLERLAASGEEETIRQAHAEYYLALAEEAEMLGDGAEQILWVIRLRLDHDNLRAVLAWTLSHVERSKNREIALRVSGSLWRFWLIEGNFSEGRQWLARSLAHNEELRTIAKARALFALGLMASGQNDNDEIEKCCSASLALYHELKDKRGIATNIYMLGSATFNRCRYEEARLRLEESLALFRELSYAEGVAWNLLALGRTTIAQGDYDAARSFGEESLDVARKAGSKWSAGWALWILGRVLFNQGNLTKAYSLGTEGLQFAREIDDKLALTYLLTLLGEISLHSGNVNAAHLFAEEGLTLAKEMAFPWGIAYILYIQAKIAMHRHLEEFSTTTYAEACTFYEESIAILLQIDEKESLALSLEGLAGAIAVGGELIASVYLWSATETLRKDVEVPRPPVENEGHNAAIAKVRAQLSKKAFKTAWAKGLIMTPAQALEARKQGRVPATTDSEPIIPVTAKNTSLPSSANNLTARELDVLHLVVEGLTNAQIAHRLGISSTTINAHLRSIYNKLDVPSRVAATRYAIDNHLI